MNWIDTTDPLQGRTLKTRGLEPRRIKLPNGLYADEYYYNTDSDYF